MARGDFKVFDEFAFYLGSTRYDLANDAIKFGMITSVATPSGDQAEPKWGTYSANECATNADYAGGGPTLSNSTWTNSSNVATFDADDLTISQNSSGSSAAFWGIVYDDSHSSKTAIGFLDLGGPVDQQAGDITITWNASGILTATVTT